MTYYVRRNTTTVTVSLLRIRLAFNVAIAATATTVVVHMVPVDGSAVIVRTSTLGVVPSTSPGVVTVDLDNPINGFVDLPLGTYLLLVVVTPTVGDRVVVEASERLVVV